MYRFPQVCRRLFLVLLALSLLLITSGQTRAADDPVLRTAATLYEGIRTETLPNGLRVFLKPVPNSPVVTTMVAYKVGAADEDLDQTGLSHYLEHLMFKGTDKLMPGDIDRLTLSNGGANNAYTSEDLTNYHFDFAADRWEKALEIEADRMRNLRIDDKHEFQQEKGAVIEELARNEDEPWDLEFKAILPLLFGKTSPYGHPVIGEREHVRGATAAIIQKHYDKWYHPNNAALVIVGGFDPDKALAKIKELFGPLPKGHLPERKTLPAVKLERPARLEMPSKFEVPRLLLGFNTVAMDHADYHALDVIQGLLSGGKTARLYKKLVEGEEVANEVGSFNSAGRYPGWFAVHVELLKGKDRAQVEKLVLQELQRLGDKPASAAELKRVQQALVADFIFGRESVHNLADSIARGVTVTDLDFLKKYLPRIKAVTAEEVQKVARKYFDPKQAVVVWSVPKKEEKLEQESGTGTDSSASRARAPARARARFEQATPGKPRDFSLKAAQRVELPNGLVLLLLENHQLPIVAARASLRQVALHEPADKAGVAALTGYLLDEGTDKHTGQQLAELIEDVGGSLSLGSSGGSVKVLAPDRPLGLSLLFECLSRASFPKDAFGRNHERLLNQIDEADAQPDSKASMVYRALAYGKHPFGRPSAGTRETVKPLTREDCRAFHRKVFVPNNTIVAIVGDFDSKQVIEEVKRLTADWKRAELPKPQVPTVEKPKEFTQKIVTMPEAAQLHFYLGHAGIRRDDPDYYKLLVMDYVLGTGPGFTDRLSAKLRDRQGLAYSVSANITSSAGEEPGLFTCYIGTAPGHFDKVKHGFLEELKRIREEPPEEKEVEEVKKYLLGSLPFQFTSNERIAGQLLNVERHGLGFGYFDDYRKAVAAVTPADVQAVARKHLDPARMVLVAAGAVDDKGKPIGKLPPPK
jgi:zinc protease